MGLQGKVAIVTGAARGIGREIALTLADNGADVIIVDINFEGVKKVAEEINFKKRRGLAMKVDVSLKKEVFLLVKKVEKIFSRIDILVNNAAIYYRTPFEEISENEWDKVLSVNLKGTFLCSQAVLPIMKKKKYGRIVNLASMAGKTGGAVAGAHYSASKAGVACITKSLAKYGAKYGINVNAISPGFIDTEMNKNLPFNLDSIPLGTMGTPKDIANVVVFLVSDVSSYITGEIIDVDGGL